MKNHEQYKRILRFAFCAILILIQTAIYRYVWLNYYSSFMEVPYQKRGHWLMAATYGTLLIIFSKVYGGWKIGFLRTFHLIYTQCLAMLFSNMAVYLLITFLTKHFQTIVPFLAMMCIQMIVITSWGIISSKLYLQIYPPRKVLLIYGDRPVSGLIAKLHSRSDRFLIGETIHIAAGMDLVIDRIEKYGGVILCDIPSECRNVLLKYCYGKSVRTYANPKISDILIRSAESQQMFDTPLLLSRNAGLTIEQRAAKRLMDIIVSLCGIVIASPFMLSIAIAIKLNDRGRILYKQTRLTLDGKEFQIWKFRSMREDAEKDGVARLAGKRDERITEVGKIIRTLRMDELPQLFNILKGEMSVVGPRPERPEIVSEYEKLLPEFAYRLKVKAGLTGYAQVYGKYNTTAYDKLKWDLMYIQNYNLWMDFAILFKTIQILFMKESTEGMREEELVAVTKEK